jgi:hypothetical protein
VIDHAWDEDISSDYGALTWSEVFDTCWTTPEFIISLGIIIELCSAPTGNDPPNSQASSSAIRRVVVRLRRGLFQAITHCGQDNRNTGQGRAEC